MMFDLTELGLLSGARAKRAARINVERYRTIAAKPKRPPVRRRLAVAMLRLAARLNPAAGSRTREGQTETATA